MTPIGTALKTTIILLILISTASAVPINSSSTQRYSQDSELGTTSGTYVKTHEISITEAYTGNWKIKFTVHNTCGECINPGGGWQRIYLNGVAWGTEHYTRDDLYIDYEEIFSGLTLSSGDKIQIYAKAEYPGDDDTRAWSKNFRIYFDYNGSIPPVPTGLDHTNGNTWVNYTWSAGSGNKTDSYNISIGGTWYNGTTTTYKNVTLAAHSNADTILWAYNSTGLGTKSTTSATHSLTLPNTAPVMSGNEITPTTAYTGDTLNSSTHTATDAEGDSVTYTYQWYENGSIIGGQTSNTLGAAFTTKNKLYKVAVTPYDGYDYGTATYSNEVTILNTLPTAPLLSSDLTTHEINHNPTITFTKGTDADGDSVTTYVYCDTTATPTTLENTTSSSSQVIGYTTALTDGQTYYCRLRSHDGTEINTTYSDTDAFRMNSPPSIPSLSTPVNNSHSPVTNQTLDWANSTDAEGDSITYNVSINGSVVETGLTLSQTILYNTTQQTYNWTIQAYDSYEASTWADLFYFTHNDISFTFSNKSVTETMIYQAYGISTISLKVNDTDGTISSVTVEVTYAGTPFNYSMSYLGSDTWSYSFKSGAPGIWTVTNFYATDNQSGTNSTTWNQAIVVVPTAGGGGSASGGGSPGSGSPTPTPTDQANMTTLPEINLQNMGTDETGQIILILGLIMGGIMTVLPIFNKNSSPGTMIWGLLLLAVCSYGLGIIA